MKTTKSCGCEEIVQPDRGFPSPAAYSSRVSATVTGVRDSIHLDCDGFRYVVLTYNVFRILLTLYPAPGKLSREEFRRQKDLDAARKAGTAPAALDEEGKPINPHIPRAFSSDVLSDTSTC